MLVYETCLYKRVISNLNKYSVIRHRKIKYNDESGNGEYSIFESRDFEFVNPIEHYSTAFIVSNFTMMKDLVLNRKLPFALEIIEKTIMKKAVINWEEKLNETLKTEIPENFISVLKADSKKEQVRLLKDQSITPEQLLAFIFKSYTDFGFCYSQYIAEHNHNGLEICKMPPVAGIVNGKVHKIGNTTLTDGQLKQAIEERKVIVSKFLDNGSEWHCLFLTYNSLKGKETWKNGQPHYHYISNKFGIPREKVVEQLKSKNYNLGSLPHIDLIDFRDKNE